MRRLLFFAVLLLAVATSLSFSGQASAQEYNHVITVYATVPEMRAAYLDAGGNIYKIAGNTSDNITPKVYNDKNQEVALTDALNRQYQRFLNLHGGRLTAGKIYNVNPISVDTEPNLITISL